MDAIRKDFFTFAFLNFHRLKVPDDWTKDEFS